MGSILSPVRTQKFRKFLKEQGCSFRRIKGDHEIWGRKDLMRDIVFITNEKEIPPFHLRNNLKTLGVSVYEFINWLNK